MAQLQAPFGIFGKVRKQLWVFMAAMAITGALMALGYIYLAPAHEDFFAVNPDTTQETFVQSRG